jgi:hypothetical protein
MAQTKAKKTLAKRDTDEILARMERITIGEPEIKPPVIVQVKPEATLPTKPSGDSEWIKGKPGKVKTTVVRCIVVDKLDHWHGDARVDLHGADTTAYSWGYYGGSLPVLVEQPDGKLQPFFLPDTAGESSNRLFKGANPEGWRAALRHRSNILQKLAVGLMVALVLGLFFIAYILIGYK